MQGTPRGKLGLSLFLSAWISSLLGSSSLCYDSDSSLLPLLLSFFPSSPNSIILIIPIHGFSRQARRSQGSFIPLTLTSIHIPVSSVYLSSHLHTLAVVPSFIR